MSETFKIKFDIKFFQASAIDLSNQFKPFLINFILRRKLVNHIAGFQSVHNKYWFDLYKKYQIEISQISKEICSSKLSLISKILINASAPVASAIVHKITDFNEYINQLSEKPDAIIYFPNKNSDIIKIILLFNEFPVLF